MMDALHAAVIEIQNSVNFHLEFFAKEMGRKRIMKFDFWFFNHSIYHSVIRVFHV